MSVDVATPFRTYRRRPAGGGAHSVATAEAYGRICAWRLKHIPWMLEPGGAAIFFRLMRAPEGLYSSDVYRCAGASAPKVLATVEELRRKGLITVIVDPGDRRRRRVEATDLLRRLAHGYVQAMEQIL
jgi:DNA-binding MarR family transcriptional regulator